MAPGGWSGTTSVTIAVVTETTLCICTNYYSNFAPHFSDIAPPEQLEKEARQRRLRAASIAQIKERLAAPAPRPFMARIPGQDIRRFIPRRV